MKTLKLLSALFLAVLVSMVTISCGDDDEEKVQDEIPALLKGFWQMDSKDFDDFKSLLIYAQEEDESEQAELMLDILNSLNDIMMDVTDENVFLVMHVNPSKLSAKYGVNLEKEYVALPYIESNSGVKLVVKTAGNNAGALYEKDSQGEELVMKYSNLTKNSVDVSFYSSDDVVPAFSTTLFKIDGKYDYDYVLDLEYNNDGDDDDDDDWGDE